MTIEERINIRKKFLKDSGLVAEIEELDKELMKSGYDGGIHIKVKEFLMVNLKKTITIEEVEKSINNFMERNPTLKLENFDGSIYLLKKEELDHDDGRKTCI